MKPALILLMLAAPLAVCVVYAQPVRPHAAAHWVPAHYNADGFWERGHWV